MKNSFQNMVDPIGTSGLPQQQGGLAPSKVTVPPAEQKNESSGLSKLLGGTDWAAIFTTGVQVAGGVTAQRQASGKSQFRKDRIAACGRKGLGVLLSKKKRKAYNDCVAKAEADALVFEQQAAAAANKSTSEAPKSNFVPILIGVTVLTAVVGVVWYIAKK
jgi:cobalamin biosynthesis Mg chelatase CobN